MECLLRKEQLYVSLSFLTMKLVGLEGVPGRFLGSHPGGNLWHCPLRLRWWAFFACGSLGILRCEQDGRFQGGQSHATEDPFVGGGLPCDGRE